MTVNDIDIDIYSISGFFTIFFIDINMYVLHHFSHYQFDIFFVYLPQGVIKW